MKQCNGCLLRPRCERDIPVDAQDCDGFVPLSGRTESTIPLMSPEERSKQVGGNHYKDHAIQPWDIILEYKLDFWEGNALKYILRCKKDRLEDLKKARHCLDESIRQAEAKASRA